MIREEKNQKALAQYSMTCSHRGNKNGYANKRILKAAADEIIRILKKERPRKYPVFVGTGGSGISLATACVMKHRNSTMVACYNEYKTPSTLSGMMKLPKNHIFVFVDDCISMGNAFRTVYKNLKRSISIGFCLEMGDLGIVEDLANEFATDFHCLNYGEPIRKEK